MHKPSRRLLRPKIGALKSKCITVLTRNINRMMEETYKGAPLSPADGKLLIEYLKYLTEAKALEDLEKLEEK